MKKFKITFNPYFAETRIEEHFEGSAEWDVIGGDNMPELQNLTQKGMLIQNTGFEILKSMEKYTKGVKYELLYCGTKDDFYDMSAIVSNYKLRYPESKLQHIEHFDCWKTPDEAFCFLKKSFEDITSSYENSESTKLVNQIKNCKAVSEEEINILVFGLQNSGKSTLINAMLGIDILPSSNSVETATLYEIKKSKYNQVKINFTDNSDARFEFKDNGETDYNSKVDWLNELIKQPDEIEIDQKKSISLRMKNFLSEINKHCRDNQVDSKSTIQKIIVELKDYAFDIDNKAVSIIDCPGAEAAYLGAEHKKVISEAIRDVYHAVSLYVLPYDGLNWQNVQDIMSNFQKEDAERSDGNDSQIDFGRSVYVITKADCSMEQPDISEVIEKYPAYRNKKMVVVSAVAALQLRTEKGLSSRYVDQFSGTDSESAFYLQKAAFYPDSYIKEDVEYSIYTKVRNTLEKTNLPVERSAPLIRTGIPLVEYFIEDYVRRFSSVHQVKCYYDALDDVMETLHGEEKRRESELENEKNTAEKEKNRIRDQLKDICKKSCEKQMVGICPGDSKKEPGENYKNIKQELTELLSENCEEIKSRIPEFVKSTKEITKTKKDGKQKTVKNPNHVKDIEQRINESVKNKRNALKSRADSVLTKYIEQYKSILKIDLNMHRGGKVREEELSHIYKSIDDHPVQSISYDAFDLDQKKFKFKLSKFFRKDNWIKDGTSEEFDKYWESTVVKKVLNATLNAIKMQTEKVTGITKENLDQFSPALLEQQAKIEQSDKKLQSFREKMKQTDSVCKKCKNAIRSGKIDVS